MPDSSSTSRTAVADAVSPTSTLPPGEFPVPVVDAAHEQDPGLLVAHDRVGDDDQALDRWRVRVAEVLVDPHWLALSAG